MKNTKCTSKNVYQKKLVCDNASNICNDLLADYEIQCNNSFD